MTAEKAEPVARAERLRLELEKIAWMDEFLDASGAKAMMQIARDAVKADETLVPPPSEAGMELLTLADDLEGLADLLSYENTNSDAGFDRICLRAAAAIRVLSETKPVQMGCTMTDQAPELLPCPFCGGVPMLTAYQGNYNKAPSWCVDCRECDLSLDGDATPEEAVKRWNTCAAPVPRYEAEPVAWRWRHANDASQLWKYQTQPIESHSEYLQVEPLYAAPARRCDAQSVRDTTIEECAKVCDLHAQWANGHHRENEAPESTHNQLFATIDNSATDCAELIRALSKTGPVRGGVAA